MRKWALEGKYIIPDKTYIENNGVNGAWCHRIHAIFPQLKIGEVCNVVEISAYDLCREFIEEVAKGPYGDSDLKSLVNSYTVRANKIINKLDS